MSFQSCTSEKLSHGMTNLQNNHNKIEFVKHQKIWGTLIDYFPKHFVDSSTIQRKREQKSVVHSRHGQPDTC